jgi:subtilisin family serine protease
MGTMIGGDGAGPNANDIGMAYGAQWIGCRNMDVGNGSPATYIECHEFMLAPTPVAGGTPDPTKAPDVINNSWGCPPSEGCTDVNILRDSVEALTNAGIVYVASSGNSGPNCSTANTPVSIYAASFTVGAINSSNVLASFSSRGPVTVDGSNRRKPDVSAPGVNVRSSVPTSDTSYEGGWSGTSMASPHVAGGVALLLSAHPELIGRVAMVKAIMEMTANPGVTVTAGLLTCGGIASTTIPNNHFGYGRLDIFAAVSVPALTSHVYLPAALLNATEP